MKTNFSLQTYVCFCLGILLTGCSSSPQTDYQSLLDQKPSHIFNTTHDAVVSSQATPLQLNTYQIAEIRIDKPVMQLENALSNFIVFETPKLAIGTYSLDAIGGCYECLGFRKKTVLPYVALLNSEYNSVPTIDNASRIQFGYASNMLFNVFEEERYFVLVAADNRNLDKSFLTSADTYYNGGSISVPMAVQVSPEGNISVRISMVE